MGDANVDGEINIIDVVLAVSLILSGSSTQYDGANGMLFYLSNINQDNYTDILDVVALVSIILET